MGAALQKPDLEAALDNGPDLALHRLQLDIVIPRNRYLEPETLTDQEHFAEGGCRGVPPQPSRP